MKPLSAVFQNKVIMTGMLVSVCLVLSLGIGFLLVKDIKPGTEIYPLN